MFLIWIPEGVYIEMYPNEGCNLGSHSAWPAEPAFEIVRKLKKIFKKYLSPPAARLTMLCAG
jgi:hypothetical protein